MTWMPRSQEEPCSKGDEPTSRVFLAATQSPVHGNFVFTEKTVENNTFLGRSFSSFHMASCRMD